MERNFSSILALAMYVGWGCRNELVKRTLQNFTLTLITAKSIIMLDYKENTSTWLSIKMRDYERIQIFSFYCFSHFFLSLVFLAMNKTRTGSFLCYGRVCYNENCFTLLARSPFNRPPRNSEEAQHFSSKNFINLDAAFKQRAEVRIESTKQFSSILWKNVPL